MPGSPLGFVKAIRFSPISQPNATNETKLIGFFTIVPKQLHGFLYLFKNRTAEMSRYTINKLRLSNSPIVLKLKIVIPIKTSTNFKFDLKNSISLLSKNLPFEGKIIFANPDEMSTNAMAQLV
jgi:hypothetical protein